MIENQKQYEVTKSRLSEFLDSLATLASDKDTDWLMKEIQAGAMKSQIHDFISEIETFLKSEKWK